MKRSRCIDEESKAEEKERPEVGGNSGGGVKKGNDGGSEKQVTQLQSPTVASTKDDAEQGGVKRKKMKMDGVAGPSKITQNRNDSRGFIPPQQQQGPWCYPPIQPTGPGAIPRPFIGPIRPAQPPMWNGHPGYFQQPAFGGYGHPSMHVNNPPGFYGYPPFPPAAIPPPPPYPPPQVTQGTWNQWSTPPPLPQWTPRPEHHSSWSFAPVSGNPRLEQTFRQLVFKPKDLTLAQFTSGALTHQFSILFASHLLTPEEAETRSSVIEQIAANVALVNPQYKLIPYGTYPLGTANSHSDVQIYVEIVGYWAGPGTLKIPYDYKSWPARQAVYQMCAGDPNWSKLELARKAGLVIKMAHKPSNVRIQLHFGDPKEVELSQLVQLYMKLDHRVRPFLTFLRIWTWWMHERGVKYMRSFAMSLMGLVVLMEMGVVPTVEQLQAWNKGRLGIYLDNVEEIRRNFKEKGAEHPEEPSEFVVTAMLKFWTKYGELDFGKFVICPLKGRTVKDDCEQFWRKGGNLVCVKNPLVPICNVANLRNPQFLQMFQNFCKASAERVSKAKVDTVLQLFVESDGGKEDSGGA